MVRTRIVCVSDTHSYSPTAAGFKLPQGDVLIHAGDITNRGTLAELRDTIAWIEKADFQAKIVVAGNHDIALDPEYYGAYSQSLPLEARESVEDCINAMNSASFVYLNNESATIRFKTSDGLQTTLKGIYSAFGYGTDEAEELWSKIPLDTDIVVTHMPPKAHCDEVVPGHSIGCEMLRQALWRVRPRLAVCGHVHPARGAERVRWDLSPGAGPGAESSSVKVDLPPRGSKKQNLVDLTGRKQRPALDNDGWRDDLPLQFSAEGGLSSSESHHRVSVTETDGLGKARVGRNETCIVNACIRANNFPFTGGKLFNVPTIVDLDLPAEEPE